MFITDFIAWSPLVSIIVFSGIITFILTWLYKKTINYPRYKEINERQKALRKGLKDIKDEKKLAEAQKEMMDLSMGSLKLSFKPMIITFIPVLIVFALLRSAYTGAAVGDIIKWGINLPLIGVGGGWFFCYIVFSLIFSMIFRKILKM